MSTDYKLVAVGGGEGTVPLDTDSTMAADSDKRVASQKAGAAHTAAAIAAAVSGVTPTEMAFLDGATAGTQVASKAVIADANVNTGVSKVTELHMGATGSEVQIVATAEEINRACDASAKAVVLTGTAAITELLHEGRICVVTGSGSAYTYTLPEATGSGAVYDFYFGELNTSSTIFTTADATNCSLYGRVSLLDVDASADDAFSPAATDELMTLDGTTSGGQVGDHITFIDLATDKWCVLGHLCCAVATNPVTPFSGV